MILTIRTHARIATIIGVMPTTSASLTIRTHARIATVPYYKPEFTIVPTYNCANRHNYMRYLVVIHGLTVFVLAISMVLTICEPLPYRVYLLLPYLVFLHTLSRFKDVESP